MGKGEGKREEKTRKETEKKKGGRDLFLICWFWLRQETNQTLFGEKHDIFST